MWSDSTDEECEHLHIGSHPADILSLHYCVRPSAEGALSLLVLSGDAAGNVMVWTGASGRLAHSWSAEALGAAVDGGAAGSSDGGGNRKGLWPSSRHRDTGGAAAEAHRTKAGTQDKHDRFRREGGGSGDKFAGGLDGRNSKHPAAEAVQSEGSPKGSQEGGRGGAADARAGGLESLDENRENQVSIFSILHITGSCEQGLMVMAFAVVAVVAVVKGFRVSGVYGGASMAKYRLSRAAPSLCRACLSQRAVAGHV